jgi:hypothetical protein
MPRRRLVVLLGLAVALALPHSASAADRPFAPRFATNEAGDIATAGNTLMTCPSAATACGLARQGQGFHLNNDYAMTYVDVDGDAATFDSSRATLAIPAGAPVLWAGLYWGANTKAGTGGSAAPSAADRGTVRLTTPSGTPQTVTADEVDALTRDPDAYQAFADVTGLVLHGGAGSYTLANVQAGTGAGGYAGWTLVVVYGGGTQERDLRVYDGVQSVGIPTSSIDVPLTGLHTPATGPVRARLGLVGYEGDRIYWGDSVALEGSTLSNAANPVNDVFNSSVSGPTGALVTTRSPNYVNNLGYDNDVFNADGRVPTDATAATLHIVSGEFVQLGVVTLSLDRAPTAPANTTPPSITGTVAQGETLTAQPGTWTGSPTISYAYQWRRCDATGATCTDIADATGRTYVVTSADAGATIVVRVTATNAVGSTPADSAPTTALPAAPGVTGGTGATPTPATPNPGVGGASTSAQSELSTLSGSLVAASRCADLTRAVVSRRRTVPGVGLFRLRLAAATGKTVTPSVPLVARLTGPVASLRRARLRLDGTAIALRGRTTANVTPARVRSGTTHSFVVTLVPARGSTRTLTVRLRTARCRAVFTPDRVWSGSFQRLRLRVDSRRAVSAVTYRLTAKATSAVRALRRGAAAGTLRVTAAGSRLVLPLRVGAGGRLETRSGGPSVRRSGATIRVTRLPAAAGIVTVSLRVAHGAHLAGGGSLRATAVTAGGTYRLARRLGLG